MSSISRPAPVLPPSLFQKSALFWSEKSDSKAASFIACAILAYKSLFPSRLRLLMDFSRLHDEMRSHDAILMRRPNDTLYVFQDFSAVLVVEDATGQMAINPRPLEFRRHLQQRHSSVRTEFQTPQGLLACATHGAALREDIDTTLQAVMDDWADHPEFDPYYREGGCDIPWVTAVSTPTSYDDFLYDMNLVLRAFEAHTKTRIEYCSGTFRSIQPNGETGPLLTNVSFESVSHEEQLALQTKLSEWISAALDDHADRQVWVSLDYKGRLYNETFNVPFIEASTHEIMAQIASILTTLKVSS